MIDTMLRPRVLFPALALFALVGAGVAFAAPPSGKAGHGAEGSGADGDDDPRICDKLACSDDQAAKIKEIRERSREVIKPLREQVKALRKQYAEEWVKDEPDAKKLAELGGKIDGAQDKIHAELRSAMMAIHGVLDGAQREKMREMVAKRGAVWGGGTRPGRDGHGRAGKAGR